MKKLIDFGRKNLAWVLLVPLEPAGDYKTFWLTAVDLARGEPLALAAYVALFPHILGYSSFLSLFLRLFGTSPLVPPILNVLLTTASGALIYHLCLRWRDEESAVFASLLCTLCPSKLLYNTMVLSEPFYTCLLLLFLSLLTAVDERTRRPEFGYGLGLLAGLLGALLLRGIHATRPIAPVPLIAFGLWLLLLRGKELGDARLWRRWLCFAAALLLGYGLTGPLWNAYAAARLGEEPASVPGYSLYVGFNPDTLGAYADEDMDLLLQYRYEENSSAVAAQAKMLAEAKARVRSREVDFARLFPAKLRSFLGNDEGGAYYSMDALPSYYSLLAIISNVFYYALLPLALLGAWRAWREKQRGILLLAPLYVLGLTLAHMLVEVAGRYHYSIIPMLVLLAAFSQGGRRAEENRR